MARRRKFHRGRWQIARERLRISDSEPPPEDRTTHAGKVIPDLMKSLGLEEQHWLTELADTWTDIAGETLAAHTRPGRVTGDRLTVFVDNSAWLNELQRYGKQKLLANVREEFGAKIESLDMRLDPDLNR